MNEPSNYSGCWGGSIEQNVGLSLCTYGTCLLMVRDTEEMNKYIQHQAMVSGEKEKK